ncbi:hypothetical protein Bca52824_051316 [Brassica carinata]|uniref:AB hydrolase-1 domain-containing protein n=1 Tax=Brassica carinata TaxID=52824 RepID=A0A8X7UJQ1_BRACI|nr:hypothetical protein Bca52824_051316 [Brassica carinata]
MAPSFLSVAKFVEAILRRRFSSAGLSLQTLSIDSETTIQFWGPPPSLSHENKQKRSLLLLHGFGPSAVWQWSRQVKPLSLAFRLYIPDLVFFGGSTTTSSCSDENRSEIFQASCMGKLMEKLGVERFSVVGTSYGGFVAYNMAKMSPEKVDKVILASSGVNMRRSDNEAFIARAKCHRITEVMLPSSGTDLRRFSGMVSSRKLDFVPDFVLNDFCQKMYSEKREEKAELLKGLSIGRDDKTNITPIQQDVMLIWGERDQVFPLKMAHDLRDIFYYLNSMDHLMTSTERWTNNCMGWVPPCSQLYIDMLLYIQTKRAMQASGYLSPGSEISSLLGDFCYLFPLQNLWIPGPLVDAFRSVACFSPSASRRFSNVTPALPSSPGWSRARRYRIADTGTTHLPNINIFISRLNSICAAATRPNVTPKIFFRDPCDKSDHELANLTSPGACLTYSGSLRLWQDANDRLLFLGSPQSLDVNATEVGDNWSTFLRLSEHSTWFGSFWKGSVPLYDCSASSSGAGVVRCTATDTDVNHNSTQHANPHQVGHYSMRSNLSLVFKAATSVEDISMANIFTANTYNIYLSPNDDGHRALHRGMFWNIYPDAYTRSGIETYPDVIPSLARDYHSYSRIDSDGLS